MGNWLLYGAYGFTGRLIVEEAVNRGHKPVLAGRHEAKTKAVAEAFGLDHINVDLSDTDRLNQIVADFDLVLHAAGPFIHTSEPMIQACLAGKTHYLDITGEIPVFETTFSYDTHAREQGIALISGVGFDIVPTDCMAKYVSEHLPNATELAMAIGGISVASAGTTKTMLELTPTMSTGSMIRRNGRYVHIPIGEGKRDIQFSNGQTRTVVPVPWGDLATAERATGIPNVIVSMAISLPRGTTTLAPLTSRLLAFGPLRSLAKKVVDLTVKGPVEKMRRTARSYVWACAQDAEGNQKEAWLETIEAYQLTAVASLLAVEKTLAQQPNGSLSPSMAFGADFILDVDGTERFDTLAIKESA